MTELDGVHFVHEFDNGLILLGELIPWLSSVSFDIALPAGAAHDREGYRGLAALTTEMVRRGAGPRNARQFLEDLENLGVIWSESVSRRFIHFNAAMKAGQLAQALEIFRDVVLAPRLPRDELESARQGLIQDILAREDDPEYQLDKELSARFLPAPWNRPVHGNVNDLLRVSWEDLAEYVSRHFRPRGTLIAVAGQFDWDKLVALVGELFGSWNGEAPRLPDNAWSPDGHAHVPFDSQQTHIGVAFPCISHRDPRYYVARAAVAILGGGTSSRLFLELRERRGLCYTVSAHYVTLRDFGGVSCYMGTTAEKAEEALSLLLQEIHKLFRGAGENELATAKVQFKSSLVFQQESSAMRARALVRDWSLRGRLRNIQEIKDAVDAITVDVLNQFLQETPPQQFTVVTLGPQPVEFDRELLQPQTTQWT